MNSPKITVLMSAYNADKYLTEAIESILNQTCSDFEFIIINDCSTDKTGEIIRGYAAKDDRIRVINNPTNLGLTKSLNIGLKEARGEYIARLDADDIALPERLEKQHDFMEKNKDVVLVGSGAQIINEEGKILRTKIMPEGSELIKFHLLFGRSPFFHSAIFFRKDIVTQEGGYNNYFIRAQDFELYLRLLKKYDFGNIAEPLIKYRTHDGSITTQKNAEQYAAYEKALFSFINNNYGPLDPDEFEKLSNSKHKRSATYEDLKMAIRAINTLYQRYIDSEKPSAQNIKIFEEIHQTNKRIMRKHFWRGRLAFAYKLASRIKKNWLEVS